MQKNLKRVVLEMSLKPFKEINSAYIRKTCDEALRQWGPILKDAKECSVHLWVAEGSDILVWKGDFDEPLEWARYIGYMKEGYKKPEYIDNPVSARLYTENPAVITYGSLREIVKTFKKAAFEMYGCELYMGTSFDLGPEFASSKFKYILHPEITMAEVEGGELGLAKDCKLVCSWSRLHADNHKYAGFPEGIPEGLSFGRFLGRQSKEYMGAMGFDYIWFSNGMGFSCMPWTWLGVNFNGDSFNNARYSEISKKLLSFWSDFREECPYPVEVRGTNMTTGIDLAADLVPTRELYERKYFEYPPPNSPWGALDNDFGLEITGYMSRIAKSPGNDYVFRFYTNDPWYWQSPWKNCYDREPFDIFCPLSVSRLENDSTVRNPSVFRFTTIDTQLGELDEDCPREIIPYVKRAIENFPDQPGILTWLYPFDEYHDMAAKNENIVNTIFFDDWFVRNAVNNGLPLNTIVNTDVFVSLMKKNSPVLNNTILFTPASVHDGTYGNVLADYVSNGGKVILYGPVPGETLGNLLNLESAEEFEGEFAVKTSLPTDIIGGHTADDMLISHDSLISGGALCEKLKDENDPYTTVRAVAIQGNKETVYALTRRLPEWNGGTLCWVRGTLPFVVGGAGNEAVSLPERQADKYSDTSVLARYIMSDLGYRFSQHKNYAKTEPTMTFISRHDNAFIFSGCKYDTTVGISYVFPDGSPVVIGRDADLREDSAIYYMDKSFYRECRFFVRQDTKDTVTCREVPPRPTAKKYAKRRIQLKYLTNAEVTIYPPLGALKAGLVEINNSESFPGSFYNADEYLDLTGKILEDRIVLESISGCIEVSW